MSARFDGNAARGLARVLRRVFPDDSAADLAWATAVRVASARGLETAEGPRVTPRALDLAAALPELPYADWGGALLGAAYEGRLAADERRRSGVHYTPPAVAEFLVAQVVDRGFLVDPACGAGRFLLSAVERRGGDPASDSVAGVRGFELDPEAAALAVESLALDAHGGDIAGARAFWSERINVGDALLRARGPVDAVVGNPPYFAALGHDELQALAKERFPRVHSGRNDISHFFVALALELLRDGGRFALVLPSYFQDNTFASKLRTVLAEETSDLTLYDPATTDLFDAQVHTVLLVGTKRARASAGATRPGAATAPVATLLLGSPPDAAPVFAPRVLRPAPTTEAAALLDDLAEAARTGLPPALFCDAPPEPTTLLDMMAAHTPLSELADIEKGCETGRNDVFVLDVDTAAELGIEKELLFELVKGRDVLPYALRPSRARLVYLDGKTPLERYPRAAAYLEPFRSVLLERAECKDGVYPWWRLHRPRTRALADAPEKLAAPYRTATPVFAVDEGRRMNDGGDVRFIIPHRGVDAHYLSGVLNSACVRAWLEHRGKKKGALHELFLEPLAKIPIPSPRHILADAIAEGAKILAHAYGALDAAREAQGRIAEVGESGAEKSSDAKDAPERAPTVLSAPNPEEVTALRGEIDRLVATAYGLSPDEARELRKHAVTP